MDLCACVSEEHGDNTGARVTLTQKSVPPHFEEVCSALCTTAQSARTSLMQPRSNREKERQKYYVLLQLAQGGHPLPCSTMHYG